MTISPSAIVPEVLKKDNYERWRILMQHHFEAQDLWDVVTSDKIPKRVNEKREWTKKNASALLAIKVLCEAEAFDKIKEKKSAKEAWDALAVMHRPPSVSHHETAQHQKDVSPEIVEHRAGPEINLKMGQYETVLKINEGNDGGAREFFEEDPAARPASARETEDLEKQANSNSEVADLFKAIRCGMLWRLPLWNEDSRSLLLKPDANGRIPVQLACNTGDKRVTRILYRETPLHESTTEIRFKLLEECITKKMFDIAFDLLQTFKELADPLSCPLDSVPIILTLAQMTPPFFRGNRLIFWKQWIYKCTRVKAESIKQIKEEKLFLLEFLDTDRALIIMVMACCPWLFLLQIFVWICGECVPKIPQFIQQSLACARKIHQQSSAILQECALEILLESLLLVRWVTCRLCLEFSDTVIGVLLGMLKMLCVLLWELALLPFTIVTVVVALPPISVRTLILGRKVFVPLLGIEFECTFIADVLSKLVSLFSWAFVREVYDQKTMDEYARQVVSLICQDLSKLDQKESVAVEVIFQAIKNGIPDIINKIKEAHANISWSITDPKGSGNMFACAVAHRQEEVAQLIYGSMDADLLISTDEDRNNALHIAAKLAPHSQLGSISGAALQLQSEVRWFKSVERIIPRFCNEHKNEDGETPFQVFAREHKNLLKEAEEWMKKTAESSTVVGALIITIMFAVLFTVPGGNEQNSGYPIFLPKKPIPFMVFIVSDAISLFTASSSVLMFLGILTSRYDYEDFLKSLPIKLIIGISSLFISIATMTTAFCAALFIMLPGRLEVVIPITLFGSIPIAFFGWLQFPLLVEICTSTFRRDIFQKEKESFLEKWFELFCEITVVIPMVILE